MEILNENGKTYLVGFMTEAETTNRNGRLYPFKVCKTAVLELKERVDKDGVLSYLDHPNHSDLIYEDSCGKIVELDWIEESGRAKTKVEILEDTKYGKNILEGIKAGKKYGISTRGLGELDENKVVQPGLKFITADIIEDLGQSCQVCSLNLNESVKDRTNTLDDFLLEEKDCGCDLNKLSEDQRKVVDTHVFNEIMKLIGE